MIKIKKHLNLLLTTIISFFCLINALALDIESSNGVLINLNENKIIAEKNKDEIVSIASLTKIMTSIIAIENITDFNQKVIITKEMTEGLLEQNVFILWLRVGEILTLKDLLYGTFITSGGDATQSLVLSVSKNEDEFVKLMNDKVVELGLKNTSFSNAIGLDDKLNYSTVEEVSIILKHALKNKIFKDMFFTKEYTFSNNSRTIKPSIASYNEREKYEISNIVGSKTGFTKQAGLSLASIYNDSINDINYMLVTTGGGTNNKNPVHLKDSLTVYKYYQENYKYYTLFKKGDTLLEIKVKNKNNLFYFFEEDFNYFYNKSFDKNKVKIEYDGIEYITKTTSKNEKLGILRIFYDDELIKEEIIRSNKSIVYNNYFYFLIVPVVFILFLFRNYVIINFKGE